MLPPAARAAHTRTLPSQLLFVTQEDGTVGIYSLKDPKSGPIAKITGLEANQDQMTVDASGNLFVVNNGAYGNYFYVSEFAPPYTGAPTILNTYWKGQIFFPVGITADAKGTVYVSSCGTRCYETAAVYVYPAGATSPTKEITTHGFSNLAGLAGDAKGDLYAVNYNAETGAADVYEVRAGSSKPKPLHLHALISAGGGNGVALDANGDLYVGSTGLGDYISEFRPGARYAFKVIDNLPFGATPGMIDVGPDGNLYVPLACEGSGCAPIYGYKPGARKPFEEFDVTGYAYVQAVTTAPNLQLEGNK